MDPARGSTPFVARDAQVAGLLASLARAADGRPGLVLVGGDAGVGKTRLLSRVAERARRAGATTVTSHCVDLGEVGLPYLPFAEALAQLRELGPAVDEWAAERPELARLVPAAGVGAPVTEDGAVRLQLFDGIAGALGASGRPGAPLLLVLEDLHWADASSRDVLRFLVSRLRTEHLLVVGTYRTDDLHRRHPLRPVLAELWRHPRVERLDLVPFTPEELRLFSAAVLGAPAPEDVVRHVVQRSEGNAYFAEELLESGGDTGALPESLADVLRARLEHLPDPVQRLARIASVAGRRVTEPLLRAVVEQVGLGSATLDDALREAVAHHVLVGEDGRVAFRHALLAEVVYGDLLPGEVSSLHRAYLRAVEDDGSLAPASSLAAHALAAPDLAAAVRASFRAADDAARVLAPAEELRHLETVLRLWDAVPAAGAAVGLSRVDVLSRAATAASRAGQPDRAVALARDAVEAVDAADAADAVEAVDAVDDTVTGTVSDQLTVSRTLPALRTALATYLLGAEHAGQALREAARALTELDALPPDADRGELRLQRAWTLATQARACLMTDRDEEAARTAAAAVEQARGVPDGAGAGAESDALATLAVLVVDDPDAAAKLLATARDRAAEAGDRVTEQRCAYNLATTLYYAGRIDQARDALAAGLERAHAAGLAWGEFGVAQRFFAELVRYVSGDLTPGEPASGTGGVSSAAVLDAVRLYSAAARGDHAELLADRGAPSWSPDGQVALITGGCTVDALTWAGELEAAVERATALITHLGKAWSDYFLGGIWLAALALAALADGVAQPGSPRVDASVRLGERLLERAVTTAERGRPRGGRLGPEGLAWLARARAEHSRLIGENDPALWRAATQAFAYGHRYEEARSRWRWAEALLGVGDRSAAQAQLTAAHGAATAMGAAPLTAALESLARRGRLEIPSRGVPTDDVLTPREADVLALVAQGLSNRQIGERLFISGKTVSVHVSNVLAKLGVTGRAQAVSVAHRRGLLRDGPG